MVQLLQGSADLHDFVLYRLDVYGEGRRTVDEIPVGFPRVKQCAVTLPTLYVISSTN